MAAHRVLGDVAQAPVRANDGVLRCLKLDVTFTAGTYSLGFVPAGARVQQVDIKPDTAFNGTTPTAKVGDSSDDDRLMGTASNDLATTVKASTYPAYKYTSRTEIFVVVSTSGATTGAATVYVWFD